MKKAFPPLASKKCLSFEVHSIVAMHYSPSNIIKIREDEGSSNVKTTSNDVLGIFPGESPGLLHRQIFPQELLVISKLYNKRNLKDLLQISTTKSHKSLDTHTTIMIAMQLIVFKRCDKLKFLHCT